ncbi:protein-tyrosine-phosphatase [Apilactobacillus micheneri]|uniref:Protein-tyrosine-phosphatase n=2 Tax=Apilactobacillus micheneri TaxID=1899430 RepID=A0A9Q8MUE4_9LACO|nr:protein-tyrosine-phosphatase [Apilactobacillus micheneri]TPR46198.1 protein-tyrosine-phosphatase [Apilactobacillus micheneri]TPR46883.1 protein-tyrosine-phosphatase [Apilactobacillus micheneri]
MRDKMNNKRLLDVKNGYNFRELGGYPTKDGRTIKWNKLIRSGELSELSKVDQEYLTNYGVKYDVDLRSDLERKNAADKMLPKTTFIPNPVFNTGHDKTDEEYAKQYSINPNLGTENMILSYQSMVTEVSAKKAFRNLFNILLQNNQDDSSVLFHCAQGKDRTGLSAAFILFALGVSENNIRQDYLISKEQMKPYVRLKINEYSEYGMNDILKNNLSNLYSVDEKYFDAAMDMIKKEYGNIDNFLHDFIGLSNQKIKQLRDIYLTD